jgi:hypothetical protein
VVKNKLSQSDLQVPDFGRTEEALDLDRDSLPQLVRGDQAFRAEVDIEVLLADLE